MSNKETALTSQNIIFKKNYFVKQQNIILSKKTNLQKNYKLEGNHLEANYIELINTELDTDGVYGIVNHGGDISADRLRLDSNGLFNNQNDGSINISGLVEVTNAKKFTNNANITADTLTFSIAGDFKYAGSGNIAANNHYFTIRNGNFNNAVSIVTGNFGVTADRIEINSPVTANNFNATAGDSFYHDSGTINAKNFNVTVEKKLCECCTN